MWPKREVLLITLTLSVVSLQDPPPAANTNQNNDVSGSGNKSAISTKPASVSNIISPSACEVACGPGQTRCFKPNNDCRFYNECYKQGGEWRGFVQRCPFGLYFNLYTNNCDRIKNVECTDACISNPNLERHSNKNPFYYDECDGAYWECDKKSRLAKPKCCPETQVYKEGQGCVDGNGCINMCPISDRERCDREGAGHQFQKLNPYCGQYFECSSVSPEHATEKCCEIGTSFEFGKGCVEDVACQDPCGKIEKLKACNIARINDKELMYINNNRTVICPENTMTGSNGEGCYTCVPDNKKSSKCKQTVFLNFNTSRSQWATTLPNFGAQKSWTGAVNLGKAKNGMMTFGNTSGKPEYIVVPSYSGSQIPQIYIKMRFKPFQRASGNNEEQMLATNCITDKKGGYFASFTIRLSPKEVLVTGVSGHDEAIVKVPYEIQKFNNLEVNYDGVLLSASNTPDNGAESTDTTALTGNLKLADLKLTTGSMQLGSCNLSKKFQFYGDLDEIKIWTCKPSDPVVAGSAEATPSGTNADPNVAAVA